MNKLDDYSNSLNQQETAKNFASLAMMIMGIMLGIATVIVSSDMFGLPVINIKWMLGIAAALFFIGGFFIRFTKLAKYENQFS